MVIGLSCSDYTWPKLSHRSVMKVVSDLGFEDIDIGIFDTQTHVTVPAISDNPALAANRVLELTKYESLEVADVFLNSDSTLERLSPTSKFDGDWEKLQEIF